MALGGPTRVRRAAAVARLRAFGGLLIVASCASTREPPVGGAGSNEAAGGNRSEAGSVAGADAGPEGSGGTPIAGGGGADGFSGEGGSAGSTRPPTDAGSMASCGVALPSDTVDLTARVLAHDGNDDIVLEGHDYVIVLPDSAPALSSGDVDVLANVDNVPTTYYNGALSGTGTVTVKTAGVADAKLVLTKRSTYAVPPARQVQFSVKQGHGANAFDSVTFPNGTSAIYVSHHQNSPALFIDRGVIVQLGSKKHAVPGSTAEIWSQQSSHASDPGSAENFDAIQNNGVLVVNSVGDTGPSSTWPHLGAVSGCGDLVVSGASAGSMIMTGISTYTGRSIFYATNIGDASNYAGVPNTSAIFNTFVLVYSTPVASQFLNDQGMQPANPVPGMVYDGYDATPGVLTVAQKIYGDHHGNSIHNLGRGGVDVFTGSYSYSDSGDQRNPSLSDPSLDFTSFSGNASHRIFYLHGGSITQFGDGTTSDLFAKGNEVTVTVALQGSATLGLFYAGTVAFNLPINSPAKVEGGDLFIMGAAGRPKNHVVLTQPAYYTGTTHIDANAVLQLGDGTPGNTKAVRVKPTVKSASLVDGVYSTSRGNGMILTPGAGDGTGSNAVVGVDTNVVVNNGELIVDNVLGALDGIKETTLSHISGTGSLLQLGTAPLTLLGGNTYSGGTTVGGGTLFAGEATSVGSGPVINDATLATTGPQHPINVMATYTQGPAATLTLRASGVGAAASCEVLHVAGSATLAGSLVVQPSAGFAPSPGQRWVVVQAAGGIRGTFAAVSGGGVKLVPGYDATTAFVTVGP